jgi:hypothetical protein
VTEEEWLQNADPGIMLQFLGDRASDRKLRLFAVACCRRIWHLLYDQRSRSAVEIAEAYADGLTNLAELRRAGADALAARDGGPSSPRIAYLFKRSNWSAAHAAAATADPEEPIPIEVVFQAGLAVRWRAEQEAKSRKKTAAEMASASERESQRWLVQEIFGNPFRPIPVLASVWRTAAVLALAGSIYEDRRFEEMPLLADALEEAGCTDRVILDHCRGPGPHVRGCWVLDLLLDKR